ncbi:hypothetical protein JOD43_004420 [Pullulanibacillus pueri]|uniref:Uncharacterized protein n=1 Tax=Pullulanibacillus pueri TaxID=1437324 RepID=A0A8J3A3Z1_9BACL|nr:hypothetical protein [Pullulanibacillus pueri]MBM7684205.1 hypothetical protein [Pullulanibacillus pueri]GGH88958.1 hypothetical protein GCM10007096_42470 [Pullulanibacillus pueri]
MSNKVWMPIVASVGIGAAAYQMMRPNNKMSNMVKHRIRRMKQTGELFPR